MKPVIIKKSDLDCINATKWLKNIKENKGIGLTSTDLLYFLKHFKFIDACKNDKFINEGYIPKKKYVKKGIFQYDINELDDGRNIHKRTFTVKITKKGQNYLMPFVLNLIDLKRTAISVKTQK